MKGGKHVKVEGISCSSCHLISGTEENPNGHPTFKISVGLQQFLDLMRNPRKTWFIPRSKLLSTKGRITVRLVTLEKSKMSCGKIFLAKFSRAPFVRTVIWSNQQAVPPRNAEPLTRPIGRHWFQGIVIPGIMLSNRNLQAEWFSRVDIEAKSGQGSCLRVRCL